MTALTDDISRHHWRLGVGHPDIDVCVCGWRQQRDNGQIGYNRHLIDVTKVAVRQQAAAEIEQRAHSRDDLMRVVRAGGSTDWVTGWDAATLAAAEIARGRS